jgi:putative ABC transport system permease protein
MPDWKDMSEEIAQHIDDRYRELRAGGVSHAEARRIADGERGERPPTTSLATVVADLRSGVRTMRRRPGLAATVIATLAIGIGANAAIFSLINAAVLRPLPYRDSDRLVLIWGNLHRPGVDEIPGSAGEFVDYRSRTRTLEAVAAYEADGFNLTGGGDPERVEGASVTPSFFPLLGAVATLGRTFVPEEELPGRANAGVLSHSLWMRRFKSDPSVIGRTITVDAAPMLVVGVMPPTFRFPEPATEIWKPIVLDADAVSENNRGSHGYTVLARLRSGVSVRDAETDINALAELFKTEYPNNYRNGFSVTLRRLQDEIVGDSRRGLYVLLGAVALVLLIACGNVATLQLARGAARRKEMAVRTALGANRRRIVQQLLTESLLLAAAGGVAGLLLARWAVDLLIATAPSGIPRLTEATLDGRVIAFAALIATATGLLFGIVPAVRASRADLNEVLKEGGRSAGPTLQGRAGRVLVMVEVGLSLVLLIAAGLLIRSFARIQDVRPGFESSNLLTFRLSLPASRYTTFAHGESFFDQLVASLESRPGIVRVGAINALPFSGGGGSRNFYIAGREVTRPVDQPEEQLRIVTEGYFDAMKMPVIAGRPFTARDSLSAPRVAAVNEAFAQKYFPDGKPIGGRVSFSGDQPRWYEIVGVVGNVKHRGLDVADRPELYVPYRQPLFDGWTVRPMYVVVRTAVEPESMTTDVRRQISKVDADQPISDVATMDRRIGQSLVNRRLTLLLLGAFAAFALLLAAIGIYAVVAFSVDLRLHEIGVRMALGAQRGDVLRMVVGQAMSTATVGAIAGIAAALALTRVIAMLLFGVSRFDLATFISVPVLLLAVAFMASSLPALRATHVDPANALRTE